MAEHAELRANLPHRHPILLVDRVTAEEPGVRMETRKAVSGCEPCYAGLPDDVAPAAYAYPVVLVLESFVQSAALLWARGSERPGLTLLLAALRGVRSHRPVFPGDVLCHTVEMSATVGANVFVTGATRLVTGEEVLTVASLVLSLRDGEGLRHTQLPSTGPQAEPANIGSSWSRGKGA
jgi:3-hydroxyacyl-[acyl-carrier-protein] dehydratase